MSEPSVVAVHNESGKILAIGEEARRMIGRTPGNIVAVRPLRDGVIADYDLTETMLKHFVNRATGRGSLFRPRVMVCVPAGVTSVEKRAVMEAAMQAGARRCFLIEEPLAAALGSGIDISRPSGNMVVDIGGGTTDVAVLSLGGIITSCSLKVGGDKMDEALVRYVKREHNLIIGESTAEYVKLKIGSASHEGRNETLEVRGRDVVSGLPKTVVLSSRETCTALEEPVTAILSAIKSVLEETPPELAGDIIQKGIVMTGGGSLLRDLDTFIARETGVSTHVAEDALTCVVRGTGKALESLDMLSNHLFASG